MKNILIVTAAIGHGVGGSEKALMEMLNKIDTDYYKITVLSLTEAPAHPYVNDKMQIIYGCPDFLKMISSFSNSIKFKNIRSYSIAQLMSKLRVSLSARKKSVELSKMTWEQYKPWIRPDESYYDAAIGYGVGLATYYTAEKTRAKTKIAWLNTSIADSHLDIDYCRKMYNHFDYVVTDSNNGEERFKKLYPDFNREVLTIRNILNLDEIQKRGDEGVGFTDEYEGTRILSVGRLCEAKAFHFAVNAASILKKKGLEFRWYIVGFGELETSLREQIKTLKLENDFILLGSQSNPYPFFKQTNLYVQTSIFEGSCITLEEAMAFGKPVVSTNFGAAYEKIIEGKNGLITEMNAQAIAEAVEQLLSDEQVQKRFVEYQKEHPLTYDKEISKLYSLIK